MARIIGGNPNGEFSGKLGGNVFARNKAGQYVRAYAKPVDPRTEAQVNARTTFAQAMSGFHTMDPATKAQWNSFAASYFTSKNRGNVPGLHSGANAFVALRNNFLNTVRMQAGSAFVDLSINGTPVTLFDNPTPILSGEPPSGVMEGVLDNGNYIITSVDTLDISMSTLIATFNINVSGSGIGPGPGPSPSTGSILTDGNGKAVAFSLYISNPLVQEGVFVQNPNLVLLGSTGFVDTYTTPSVVTSSIEFSITSPYAPSKYKTGFLTGQTAQFSLFMTNTDGQTLLIGSEIHPIS